MALCVGLLAKYGEAAFIDGEAANDTLEQRGFATPTGSKQTVDGPVSLEGGGDNESRKAVAVHACLFSALLFLSLSQLCFSFPTNRPFWNGEVESLEHLDTRRPDSCTIQQPSSENKSPLCVLVCISLPHSPHTSTHTDRLP